MRHGNRSARLGVKKQHRNAMMRNLTLGLVEHGRIKTTVARAKFLRTFVEPIVTRLKDPSVANLRVAQSELGNRDCVLAIAKNISPVFKDRAGGYTRIMKLATPRAGDAADMALIEWVEEKLVNAYQESPVAAKAAKKAKSTKKAPSKKVAKGDAKEVKPVKKKAAKV
jgi:large subunit ribosomal protein L17